MKALAQTKSIATTSKNLRPPFLRETGSDLEKTSPPSAGREYPLGEVEHPPLVGGGFRGKVESGTGACSSRYKLYFPCKQAIDLFPSGGVPQTFACPVGIASPGIYLTHISKYRSTHWTSLPW